jgi:hypothetical protein
MKIDVKYSGVVPGPAGEVGDVLSNSDHFFKKLSIKTCGV